MRFHFLTTAEFNRLTQAEKIAYLERATAELKRAGLLARRGSLFAIRPRRASRGKG